jgi:hypothetical protein
MFTFERPSSYGLEIRQCMCVYGLLSVVYHVVVVRSREKQKGAVPTWRAQSSAAGANNVILFYYCIGSRNRMYNAKRTMYTHIITFASDSVRLFLAIIFWLAERPVVVALLDSFVFSLRDYIPCNPVTVSFQHNVYMVRCQNKQLWDDPGESFFFFYYYFCIFFSLINVILLWTFHRIRFSNLLWTHSAHAKGT